MIPSVFCCVSSPSTDINRTFDLFHRTGVQLIDYKLSGENTPKRYNGITVYPPKDGATVEEDPFHVSESKGGMVPDQYVAIPKQTKDNFYCPPTSNAH